MSNSALALDSIAPAFDVEAARADFPILSRLVYNKPLVYLDNGASAQKPKIVLDAVLSAYADTYANVHRGAHFLSNESTVMFEKARESARRFVNARRVEEIIFTKGGTEAINLVAASLGADIGEGDQIVISEMEHHSNIVPWHFLRERKGAEMLWAPLADDDSFDLAAFAKLLTKKTKLVAVTHMSNVLGTVTPIAEIIAARPCRRREGADRRLPGQRPRNRGRAGARLRFLRHHRPQALRPDRHRLPLRQI